MGSYINFNLPTVNKRLITIGIISLVATVIVIAVVVTITITQKSSTANNSLNNGKFICI